MDLRAPYLFLYRTISFEGMEVDMEVRIWTRSERNSITAVFRVANK